MNDSDMMASGYNAGLTWCLRCDVGWYGANVEDCWLCGKSDKAWRWGWAALKRAVGLEDDNAVSDSATGGARERPRGPWGAPTRRNVSVRPRAGTGSPGSPQVGPQRSHEGERG